MLRSKVLIKVFLLLTILFCFHPINNSIAGSCDEKASNGGTSTFSGNFNIPQNFECPENPSLEYDTVNSTETIARNGTAALVVIGNNGPYTWSVSGTGFTLETEGQPTGLTNTLYADDTACGTATITVTGCVGPPVTGYVRCTMGGWAYPLVKICAPEYCWVGGPGSCTLIYGNIKYFTACEASWIPDPNCNEYDTLCDHSACIAAGGKIFSVCYQTWECP